MCFVLPKRIEKVLGSQAIIEDGRIVKTAGIKVKPGDYALVFAQLIVEKISKRQAELMREFVNKGKKCESLS